MKDFDIQLFAEEEEQTTEAVVEETPAKEEEPTQEEIPQELDGLPEDVAREAMEEVAQQEEKTEEEETPKPAESENSDKKPSEGVSSSPVNTNVPYPRFKEQVDKAKGLEAQLEAYRAKYGEIGSDNQPKKQEDRPAPNPQPSDEFTPQFTPEISERIEEAVRQKALMMTGLSADDATSLEEYGDDDNPKYKTLENAKSMARQMIIGEITEALRQQQAQRVALLRQHQSMMQDYNEFVARESAAPDFADVQAYAVGDYFNKLSQADQAALRDAYARTENQSASAQDMMLVKRYFAEAKAAFHGGKPKGEAATTPVNRTKPSLPRASEVDGSASIPAEGVTNESLAKMLDEMDPDDIPEKYRKLLMG